MTTADVLSSEAKREFIVRLLQAMTQNVSLALNVDFSRLRSNIFVPDEEGVLRIAPGLHHNMEDQRELTVRIKAGTGCAGRAYQDEVHKIAILGEGWGEYELPGEERDKIDRNLRWIISVPVPDIHSSASRVAGVMNVDCLHERKEPEELEPIVPDLYYWARLIAEALSRTGGHHGTHP